ncbi:MAG: peptidase [Acidobacteria bacterium]|nr:peptidase [Acidobacteriota bacterium]
MLLRPRFLPPGGHIGVVAASGPSERPRVEEAARKIESRGYRVTLAGNIDHRHNGYLAGSDDERAAELNRFLRSEEFDAFFFARGGYGAMRILDQVDYQAIRENPRPIVGFSDVTALHQAIAVRAGVVGFHGPMLNLDFHQGLPVDIERWLWDMLAGEAPMTHRFDHSQVVAEGEAEGILFGGCLALTDSLVGTPYDFWVDGGIWFWEDVEEPVYRIDRMLTHLRLSGRMPQIRGVVIGKLKGCGEESELLALLTEFFGSSGIPVIRNVPFGHHGDNLLLPIGVPARLSTREGTLTITTPAVRRP